ncbi:cell division protein FtsL [Rhizobium halophytocola]|uniref:Cell division protein FtsL n=1 Tax=Rhizobium halophytocola TaxID=735519 RepID=A0ABS4E320_9HYPH|nr:hypothetical protein [Rhizobium halophytocola]MBP1852342.1 hypothetical protein [Rhizobium halophytocola]
MLKTLDFLMIGAMLAAATVTYQIKHHAEDREEEVQHLEAKIKLERDTLDLLKADWALLTQPNRLEKLVQLYGDELKLQPTDPTQLARPHELPMIRPEPTPPEVAQDGLAAPDTIATGSVRP